MVSSISPTLQSSLEYKSYDVERVWPCRRFHWRNRRNQLAPDHVVSFDLRLAALSATSLRGWIIQIGLNLPWRNISVQNHPNTFYFQCQRFRRRNESIEFLCDFPMPVWRWWMFWSPEKRLSSWWQRTLNTYNLLVVRHANFKQTVHKHFSEVGVSYKFAFGQHSIVIFVQTDWEQQQKMKVATWWPDKNSPQIRIVKANCVGHWKPIRIVVWVEFTVCVHISQLKQLVQKSWIEDIQYFDSIVPVGIEKEEKLSRCHASIEGVVRLVQMVQLWQSGNQFLNVVLEILVKKWKVFQQNRVLPYIFAQISITCGVPQGQGNSRLMHPYFANDVVEENNYGNLSFGTFLQQLGKRRSFEIFSVQ